MFYVACLLLSPLIALLSVYLRLTTIKLPEASGVREGIIGDGGSFNILYLGDSAAAGVGVEHLDNALVGKLNRKLSIKYKVHWHLIANNGDRTQDAINKLENLSACKLDITIVSLGVNEVTSGCSLTKWRKSTHQLIKQLRNKFGCSNILLTCVPPMASFPALHWPLNWLLGWRAEQLNKELARICSEHAYIHFLTPSFDDNRNGFAVDGFHPNEVGYEIWAQAALEVINSLYT